MRWRDLLYPKSGSRRAGLNHTGLSDFKFSALPRKAESPEGVQKGTHKVCGGQGGSPVHGHSGCLMYGGGGGRGSALNVFQGLRGPGNLKTFKDGTLCAPLRDQERLRFAFWPRFWKPRDRGSPRPSWCHGPHPPASLFSSLKGGSCGKFRLQTAPRERNICGATEAEGLETLGTGEPAQRALRVPARNPALLGVPRRACLRSLGLEIPSAPQTGFPLCATVSICGDAHPTLPKFQRQVLQL